MHELPIKELMRKLAEYDELTVLELLEINSHQLVRLLADVIEDKYTELLDKLPDDEEDDE